MRGSTIAERPTGDWRGGSGLFQATADHHTLDALARAPRHMVKLCRGGTKFVEHRGVRYEIKIAVGRSQWTWIVHTSPKPLEGSIGGPKRDAILAAEKTIDRWWAKRLRTMKVQAGASMPS